MFKEIFLFELFYRKNRPATYVYFAIAFFLGFLAVASPIIKLGGAVGTVYANAPYMIFRMTLVASFALSIITSAVVSVTIIRDFDHNMDVILFTMPIRKWDYLMGRFFGSFVLLILINSGIFIGFITGFSLGKIVPWEVVWKSEEILSFDVWSYLNPFLVILLPNLFFTSALFFMSGALWRNSMVIYAQGILLIILYQLGNNYLRELDSQYIAAIIDPFAIQTFLYETRYWTPAEQNTLLIPFNGVVLYNRLLWVGIGIAALPVTYYYFSFTKSGRTFTWRKKKAETSTAPVNIELNLPVVNRVINKQTYLRQIIELSSLYFKMTWREIPFLAIVGGGVLLFFLSATKITSVYGTSSYPTTSILASQISNAFNLFLTIIAVFYTGELVWKERSINFNQITDALPTSSFLALLSKFSGLLIIYISLMSIMIGCGIIVQVLYGYYHFEFLVYIKTFSSTLISLISFTLVFMFIQVISGNKFAGFVWCVMFLIITALLNQLGLEHDLWQFDSGTLGVFSDMNLFGHFVLPFIWFKVYWLAFACVLLSSAVVLYARGMETSLNLRWRAGKQRFSRPMVLFSLVATCAFLFAGSFIYYNTNVINTYKPSIVREQQQVDYEKTLKKYRGVLQPKIVESNTMVSLYPSKRSFTAEGFYYLKNKSQQPLQHIHIQNNIDDHIKIDYLQFSRASSIKEAYPELCYFVYELSKALQPGDSIKMNFKLSFTSNGFEEGQSNTDVVYNGTFFNNSYFPSLGYNDRFELKDRMDRKKYGLKFQNHLPPPNTYGSSANILGNSADRIRFEMMISTDGDQIAIAPGFLVKEWREKSRNYFQYRTNVPISNFYSIVSGRYKVKKEKWKDTDLEIYYHQGHEYNLNRMMKGMKDALSYCSDRFGPFQYKQLRIIEFPRYNTFAQSFANTIPFSEGIGFLLKSEHPDKDLDMAYYVTAHEVAHQWWGHQVMPGNMKGNAMLSEGLSQYSALMVMKHVFSPEILEHYLKYELDNYLKGRTRERERENPLEAVEDQQYVYYNKASIVFYALQDYIGEDSLDVALKRFNKEWSSRDGIYSSTKDLINQIIKVTPDSLRYLIHDMFETVTLFENRVQNAVYKEDKKGKFEVTLSVSCEKMRIDSAGMEQKTPLKDWIDVGVYALDDKGKEKLVYLKKHLIKKKNTNIVIIINKKPVRAGIDPLHKLPDRYMDDNVAAVKEFINITNLPVEF